MNRKDERKWVVKLLFQHNFNEINQDNLSQILDFNEIEQSEFIVSSITSVINNLTEIDNIISPFVKKKLHNIEKTILRVSVNEFVVQKTVPNSVSINEAVELAKEFGNEDSYKMINGILSNINKGISK